MNHETSPAEQSEHFADSLGQGFPVTKALMFVILLCYLASTRQHGFQHLDEDTAMRFSFFPEAVQAGQWYRFLTAPFLHADWSHLLSNLFGLYMFGQLLEPAIGRRAILVLYLLSMLGGLALSYILLPLPTLGASMMNFGLIGAYMALILVLRFRTRPALFWQELRNGLILAVLFMAWNWVESGRVNGWGHLGGFVVGFVYGLTLLKPHNPHHLDTP